MKQKPILTGLAYLLELANPATREDYEAMVARIKPLLDATEYIGRSKWRNAEDAQLDMIKAVDAINGIESARMSLGMEKGE